MQKIQDALARIYEILKLTPGEIEKIVNDLVQVQQVAVSTELMKSLTEGEIKTIEALEQKSDDERRVVMEQIAKAHAGDEGFKVAAQAVAKKVLDEHIAYLKTRGDDSQKIAIVKILEEVE